MQYFLIRNICKIHSYPDQFSILLLLMDMDHPLHHPDLFELSNYYYNVENHYIWDRVVMMFLIDLNTHTHNHRMYKFQLIHRFHMEHRSFS